MASVRYIVDDVDSAVAFYTQALGFDLRQQYGPAMAILTRDNQTLWVAGPAASASRPMPDGAKPQPGGWSRFVLDVADLSSMVVKLRERGVRFRNDIVDGPGGRQILCEDPAGNAIELFEARADPLGISNSSISLLNPVHFSGLEGGSTEMPRAST